MNHPFLFTFCFILQDCNIILYTAYSFLLLLLCLPAKEIRQHHIFSSESSFFGGRMFKMVLKDEDISPLILYISILF